MWQAATSACMQADETHSQSGSAEINGVPVAIEVQLSELSIETIMQRTTIEGVQGPFSKQSPM